MEVEIILAVVFFLAGISVGSFLNVVADRVPLGMSLVSPPSHCFKCGRNLERRDMIPVISHIILRGKCRHCAAAIPARSMIVELCTGVLYVLAWLKFGLGWTLLWSFICLAMFMVLLITDLEGVVLPHKVVYPGIGIALVLAGINTFTGNQPDIISSMVGFAAGYGIFLLIWGLAKVFKKRIIGFGDVGMAGLIGASVGFPLIAISIYLAVLAGGISIALLILFKMRKISDPISFGLFLSLGTIATILYGAELMSIAQFLLGK